MMWRRYPSIMIMLFIASVFTKGIDAETSFDALFNKGNQYFEAGDVELARDAYESIIKQGFSNAYIYYNLGNCYMKLGDKGRAILNLRRAHRIDPNDEDIQANLEIVRQAVSAIDSDKSPDGWYDIPLRTAERIGERGLSITTAILWWITAGFFVVGYANRLRRNRRRAFRIAAISFVICLTSASGLLLFIYNTELTTHAVAVGDAVIARNGPGQHFTEVFEQQPGYEMIVGRTQSGWVEVTLSNGYTAWVPANTIEFI